MSSRIEVLEGRTLFSGGDISQVTADYETVVADAAALKSGAVAAVAVYKSDVKTIAADIKVLPKSKTNAADEAKLSKAATAAGAVDTRDVAKIVAVGKADLNKARVAFLAAVNKPTATNSAKLNAALTILNGVLAAPEAKLSEDVTTGQSSVFADLGVLVSANPTDTQLSTDATTAEDNQAAAINTLSGQVVTTNADVAALVAAIQ